MIGWKIRRVAYPPAGGRLSPGDAVHGCDDHVLVLLGWRRRLRGGVLLLPPVARTGRVMADSTFPTVDESRDRLHRAGGRLTSGDSSPRIIALRAWIAHASEPIPGGLVLPKERHRRDAILRIRSVPIVLRCQTPDRLQEQIGGHTAIE